MSSEPSGYLVATDAGGTTVKSAVLRPDLSVVYETRSAMLREDGPGAARDRVLAQVRDTVAWGRTHLGERPRAIGLATLGLVDEQAGTAVWSSAVGWRDVPFRRLVADEHGVPVGFGHDIRAAARAEAQAVAGEPGSSLLFVALGTGIGGAVVVDGVPLAGGHGRAGEIGHVAVSVGDHALCPCGQRGCLETVASARGITERFEMLSGRHVAAVDIAAAALRGEPEASRIWREAIEALAEVFTVCALVVDPSAIVLGGGLAQSGDQLLAPLRDLLAARHPFGSPPPLLPAVHGDRAALVGAGLLARDAARDGGRP
ncbi:ROK family protein [Nocardioides panacihumi]|uniref:ROK family protein n=1 Tax=Nocardioides panacihumi TaxID=400774 RepID=A0ABN2RKW0_9ACTN